MTTLTLTAPAKINLYLDVTARRENGYHDVITVMQSVSLADTLTFTRALENTLTLDTGCELPADDSNLILRAARAYFAASGAPFGVHITLQKNIPMAAGLGGGSADAAATLRALNMLDEHRFSVEQLCEIGATIGADVPFCVMGGTCIGKGIGELLTPVPSRISPFAVIAIAGEGVSTPLAFAALDAAHGNFVNYTPKNSPNDLLAAMAKGDVFTTVNGLFNSFEAVVEPMRPMVTAIKEMMLTNGALAAQMSGSGPSVFGVFATEAEANAAARALTSSGARAFVATFVGAYE